MNRLFLTKNHLSNPNPPTYPKLSYELTYSNQIAIVTLNSPSDLNVLSQTMRHEISTLFEFLNRDYQVKVILLQSQVPKAFCAGANIKEFVPITSESYSRDDAFEPLSTTLTNMKKPIVAAVNGVAAGGGFEVVLNCDIIIASEDAKFAFPEIKLGLIPGIGGTQRFTKIVGRSIASRYILTGEFFTAQQAKTFGVVSEVCKVEELRNLALDMAKKVADMSMYTAIAAKDAVKQANELGIGEGLKFERRVFQGLFNTKAVKEGVDAFLKKRKADFNGI